MNGYELRHTFACLFEEFTCPACPALDGLLTDSGYTSAKVIKSKACPARLTSFGQIGSETTVRGHKVESLSRPPDIFRAGKERSDCTGSESRKSKVRKSNVGKSNVRKSKVRNLKLRFNVQNFRFRLPVGRQGFRN